MSVSNILLRTGANAGKINPALIVGGGGGGQVDSVNGSSSINVSADPVNPVVNIAFTASQDLMVGTGANAGAILGVGANGTYLGVNQAGQLAYSNPPQQGIAFNAQGQMLYSGVAPGFADTLLNIGNAGQVLGVNAGVPAWTDAGGSGLISANAPLFEEADQPPNPPSSKISINFTAVKGEIPAGTGGAKVGALIPPPAHDGYVLRGDNAEATGLSWSAVSECFTASTPLLLEEPQAGDPVISIGFTAVKGEIPAGTGASSIGALVPAPTADNQVLISANAEQTGLKWVAVGGSGTITGTFPIVESDPGTNISNIAIGFANKGELAVGSGTTGNANGVILPPATADNYVLSSFSSAPSGMRWVAPTATQSIVRSKTATTSVSAPQTTQDTLILVAEDPQGSWDLQEDPTNPGTPITPYAIETESDGIITVDGVSCSCIAVPEIVNGIRCIHLYIITNSEQQSLGILYRGSYSQPSFVSYIQNPITVVGTLPYIADCFIVSGSFENFHADGDNPPPDVAVGGIALIDCKQLSGGVVVVKPLIDVGGQIGNNITGVVNDGSINDTASVYKTVQLGNSLFLFGNFDGFNNGGTNVLGWWSIAEWNLTTGSYDIPATTVGIKGLGVSFDANIAPGTILDAYLGVANTFYIVGAWSFVASIGATIPSTPVNTGMLGFGKWVSGQNPNPWVSTPILAGGLQEGFCIRPSLTQTDNLIIAGFAPNVPIFLNIPLNTLTASTGAIPAQPQQGWSNSIVSVANIDIGFGVNTYDFVQYQDKTSGDMYVVFFNTATALVAQPLSPTPTGLQPYYVPNKFPPSYNGPYTGFTNYGIRTEPLPSPNINVMATGGIYRYDPAIHANLDFTGQFYFNGTLYGTARFSTATQGNESQSFVSATSLKAWIQTGAKTTSLSYL